MRLGAVLSFLLLAWSSGGCGLLIEDDFVAVDSDVAADGGGPAPGGCGAAAIDCNASCPGSCLGTTCFIECSGREGCQDRFLSCPRGMNCEVECSGEKACENVTLNCVDSSCGVSCSGKEACKNLERRCTKQASRECGVSCGCDC